MRQDSTNKTVIAELRKTLFWIYITNGILRYIDKQSMLTHINLLCDSTTLHRSVDTQANPRKVLHSNKLARKKMDKRFMARECERGE